MNKVILTLLILLSMNTLMFSSDEPLVSYIKEDTLNYRIVEQENNVIFSSRIKIYQLNNFSIYGIYWNYINIQSDFSNYDSSERYTISFRYKF